MPQLKASHQYIILLLLLTLMVATRFHHFGSALHLPDASWAIFFLAGFYLSRIYGLFVLLLAAGVIDYFAITQLGTSDYCITPAYGFLLPTYAALWWGGRWFRGHYHFNWSALLPLAGAVLASVSLAFLVSNGSFYLLSGKFVELSVLKYSSSVMPYFFSFLKSSSAYIAIFGAIHIIITLVAGTKGHDSARHA